MPRLVLKFRDLFSFGGWEWGWGAGEGTAGLIGHLLQEVM